jgi:hypothetical protein
MDPNVGFALALVFTGLFAIAGLVAGTMRFWWTLAGTCIFVGIALLLFLGFAAESWYHLAENGCIAAKNCYCELQNAVTGAVPHGKVRQPGGTLSAFFPVLSGVLILGELDWRLSRGSSLPPGPSNPMALPSVTSVLFGIIVILLGPGSMMFHASIKAGPGVFDPISIVLFATFVLSYSVWRSVGPVRRDPVLFHALFFVSWLVLAGALVAVAATGHEDVASMLAIIPTIAWELARLIADTAATAPFGERRNVVFGWSALGSFGVAFFFWRSSFTDAFLCVDRTSSILQGHNLWHLGAMGVAPYLIFRYFQSEAPP